MLRPSRGALPRALAVLLSVSLALIVEALPASASPAGDTLSYTNSARSSHGLAGYSTASDLTRLAQEHASWMASHHSLQHTSNLSGKVCCWKAVGENVGYGPSARAVFDAFMNSSSHRANILSGSYTQIGVGTARSSDGTLWVDQIFRQPSGSSGSRTVAVAPHRASRSSTRAPLHFRAPSQRPSLHATLLGPVQRRQLQLQSRYPHLRSAQGDPLRRSAWWLRSMGYLTAP